MFNLKGFVYLVAFAVWVIVMTELSEALAFTKDALYSYGGSTFLIVLIAYIVIVLMEFFVDIERLD